MSSGYPWTAWLFWIGGAVLALSGVALFYWAMFRDRSRGRKRCPKCWYDLSTMSASACPECGKVVRHERHLRRTRRHWRWAAASMLTLLVAGLIAYWPRGAQRGWLSDVPSRLLIWYLPLVSDMNSSVAKELLKRVDGDMSDQSRLALIHRCAIGDWTAPPESATWSAKYGTILMRIKASAWGLMLIRGNDTSLRNAVEDELCRLPAHFKSLVPQRTTWPEGVPLNLHVELDRSNWLVTTRCRAIIRIHGSPDPPIIAEDIADAIDVPITGHGKFMIPLDVQFQRGRAAVDHFEWSDANTATASIAIEVGGALSDFIQPTVSTEMNDAIEHGLEFQVSRPQNFSLNPSGTWNPIFKGTAVGIIAEFRKGDEVVCEIPYWWAGGGGKPDICRAFHTDLRPIMAAQQNENWTVRIRSDPKIALRVPGCDTYWEGNVTTPLKIIDR